MAVTTFDNHPLRRVVPLKGHTPKNWNPPILPSCAPICTRTKERSRHQTTTSWSEQHYSALKHCEYDLREEYFTFTHFTNLPPDATPQPLPHQAQRSTNTKENTIFNARRVSFQKELLSPYCLKKETYLVYIQELPTGPPAAIDVGV